MAYTAAVTSPMKAAERISRSFGFFAGKCDVTLYDTTLVAITGISKYFATGGVSGFTKGLVAVIPTGVSDNGHIFEWDYTTGAFKCYKPTNVASTSYSIAVDSTVAGGALTFDSGGGVAALHAVSAVGNIVRAQAAVGAAAIEAGAVDVGSVGFIAIGFLK